jgi:TRAP-type C4-dicarboxylate transport system substrate-binding protein
MTRDSNGDPTEPKPRLTRREFNRLVSAFGATVACGVLSKAARAAEPISYQLLAQRAEPAAKAEARAAAQAQVNLRFGVSGHTPATMQVLRLGLIEFKEDVAKRTNGAVNIELLGGNSICTELTCVQKCLAGTIHGYNSSTQNAARTVPFFNCLDFPYLFPNRASMFHFFYHPASETLLRRPLRERFNVEFLWTSCELRNLYMGLGWRDKQRVRRPEDIRGSKIRVTGSDLGRIAVNLFGANAIPLDWAETLEGLKSGVVDGQETSSAAAAAFNMGTVTSQDVVVEFFSFTEHTAMDARVFSRLDSKIQQAIRESAFDMQQFTQRENEKSLQDIVGLQDPPKPGTIWAKHGVKVNVLTKDDKAAWVERASPQSNPKPYEAWRERVAKLGGGTDVYAEIHRIAREVPENTRPDSIPARRWWTAA